MYNTNITNPDPKPKPIRPNQPLVSIIRFVSYTVCFNQCRICVELYYAESRQVSQPTLLSLWPGINPRYFSTSQNTSGYYISGQIGKELYETIRVHQHDNVITSQHDIMIRLTLSRARTMYAVNTTTLFSLFLSLYIRRSTTTCCQKG